MTIKRNGRCAECTTPTTERKTFDVTVSLFDQTSDVKIEGELSREIKAWRKTKLFCGEHGS